MEIKTITRDEWFAEGERRFGKDKKKWKFKCPNCGNIQSYEDFLKVDIAKEEIANVFYFSCIGRWMDDCKGEIGNKKSPCNYTNGGLFNFSKLRVIDEDGNKISVFEFAEN